MSAVESLPVAEPPRQWDRLAGAILLVRDDTLTRAIFPDVTALDSSTVFDETIVRGFQGDALAPRGLVGALRVRDFATVDEECVMWPVVRLSAAPDGEWTVAVERGASTPLPLRPIESLSRGDSARLAAQLTRLAATLPNDTARAFHGLPFVIRAAHRFDASPGVEAAVAEILRRVNVEANPREETLLLIAERDTSAGGEWRAVYAERAAGEESVVAHAIPLAAFTPRSTNAPALLVERAGAEGTTYALVQRQRDGQWRDRWRSAQSGC
jgi:hypothetical protein